MKRSWHWTTGLELSMLVQKVYFPVRWEVQHCRPLGGLQTEIVLYGWVVHISASSVSRREQRIAVEQQTINCSKSASSTADDSDGEECNP